MLKSGLIVGAIALVFVTGSTLIHPFCAPCLGVFFGLAAGYFAGVSDKPLNSSESLKKGALAGAIAGALGLVGGFIGGAINAALVNPADVANLYRMLGISGPAVSQGNILTYQMVFAFCVGLFNVVWMAILGLAGGAIWYQVTGKKRATLILPPQDPLSPAA